MINTGKYNLINKSKKFKLFIKNEILTLFINENHFYSTTFFLLFSIGFIFNKIDMSFFILMKISLEYISLEF